MSKRKKKKVDQEYADLNEKLTSIDGAYKYAESYETDTDEKKPYGCRACGGPWPKCKISCPIYDD